MDSSRADDTGDGLTPATAKKTLAAGVALLTADAPTLGLARDGYWQEQVNGLGSYNLVAYGSGALPEIDGAGAVSETWAQHDAGGFPNTWNIDVTHGFTLTSGRLMIWEDGTMLKRVSSIALVDAEAGTYYSPNDNNFTIATVKVYAHATGSGNPNSNGRLYERTQRSYCVYGAYSGQTGQYVHAIHTKRQGANDGSLILGKSSTIDGCICSDGHKHNALQESGVCKNSAFFNAQPESNYLHVFYTTDAAGLTARYENCVFVGQANGLRGTSGIYCHDNSGAAHSIMTIRGVCFVNMATAMASAAVTLDAMGVYVENCNASFDSIAGTTSTISHLLTNKQYLRNNFAAAGTHLLKQSAIYLLNNTSFMQMSLANWGDVTYENVTIHMGDWDTTITSYNRYLINRTTGTGTFTASNILALMDGTDTTIAPVVNLNTASIGASDSNAYFYRGTFAKSSLKWNVDASNKTFAEWQALGQDANSVTLDATTITFANLMNGLPSAGDFRIKAGVTETLPDATAISTLGVQQHWDFNAKGIASGAPSAWPTPPKTLAQCRTFVAGTWTF